MPVKVEIIEKTSHCIFCGENLTQKNPSNICNGCQKKVLCTGMKQFKSHLKMMMLGVEHQNHQVGSDIILTAYRKIAETRNGHCCDGCSACNLFNGVRKIISQKGYVEASLHLHASKLKKYFSGGESYVSNPPAKAPETQTDTV